MRKTQKYIQQERTAAVNDTDQWHTNLNNVPQQTNKGDYTWKQQHTQNGKAEPVDLKTVSHVTQSEGEVMKHTQTQSTPRRRWTGENGGNAPASASWKSRRTVNMWCWAKTLSSSFRHLRGSPATDATR